MGITNEDKLNAGFLMEELFHSLGDYKRDQERVFLAQTPKGEVYPVVRTENREWHLNSRYNAEYAADVYAKERIKAEPFFSYFLFGFGDGRIVKKFYEIMDDTNILVVYEPDPDIFCSILEYDPQMILKEGHIIYIVKGVNDYLLVGLLHQLITYSTFQKLDVLISPLYDILYPEACSYLIDRVIYEEKRAILNRNTETDSKMKMTENLLYNMYDYVKNSDLFLLKKELQKENLTDIPAIIVGAGPSLDKNIKDLKLAEGKAFIIGVDTALKALIREGIQFQLGITVDPAINMKHFREEAILDVPFILEPYSIKEFVEIHRGRRFYSSGYGSDYCDSVCSDILSYTNLTLATGGSVSTNAFSLVEQLGFKTIILIGQDLSFSEGRSHVSSFWGEKDQSKEYFGRRKLTEVEDIYGNMVQTDVQMSIYLDWFSNTIYSNNQLRVIDATEGGAKIPYTEIMTLREAIAQTCDRKVDFDKRIQETPDTFTDGRQKEIFSRFLKIPEELDRIDGILKKMIRDYEKLAIIDQSRNAGKQQYTKALKALKNMDELLMEEPLLTLISQYNSKVEYKMTEDIFQCEDISVSELSERAVTILKGYRSSMDDFRKDLCLLLNQIT